MRYYEVKMLLQAWNILFCALSCAVMGDGQDYSDIAFLCVILLLCFEG